MYEEIIIAGFGGQGVLFAGTLLAQASVEEGLEVTFFPSYGAEMRGGTAKCTVIISGREIGSPISLCPTNLLVLNQESFNKYSPWLRKGGLLVINSSLVKDFKKEDWNIVKIPATEIADRAGFGKGANLVALGAYIRQTKIVSLKKTIKSLKVLLKGKESLQSINRRMLEEGYNFGQQAGRT